ncbi:hypothetical protein EVAR_63403_1 [Eumeta japonica]|uniref:Uncharacterized protein n=1 Tax=Eumeta variegata TaxID=151549 RepID=A0A4C1YYE7_EUMVA|nr:hypothetical protein EVAR_63403_1 [Eumeta japonica]
MRTHDHLKLARQTRNRHDHHLICDSAHVLHGDVVISRGRQAHGAGLMGVGRPTARRMSSLWSVALEQKIICHSTAPMSCALFFFFSSHHLCSAHLAFFFSEASSDSLNQVNHLC